MGRVAPRVRRRLRRRDEAGYVAILVAFLFATVFMGMSAVGVDTARWYMEVEDVQKAADAAALAGVTYMPNDLATARTTAIASATKNGYPNSGNTTVTVVQGDKPSELKVTISSKIKNTFGRLIGVPHAHITRSAVADYTAPAPMGSPCNTFGNEPPSQALPAAQPAGSALHSVFPNCTNQPNFWGAIEGPSTNKVQGDRYMTSYCSSSSTYQCGSSKNSEYRSDGYYWAVHVEPQAVNTPISVQIYDPAYMFTQITCASLPNTTAIVSNDLNDWARTDARTRYANVTSTATARRYCSGDYDPDGASPASPVTTTFVLRHQNDTFNPRQATPIPTCTKQFAGLSTPPTQAQLTRGNSAYNAHMVQLFHQWVELCTFTPDRPGDYYVQVRTNVTTAGGTAVANPNPAGGNRTPLIFTGNTAAHALAGNTLSGVGLNSFALRAVPSDTSKAQYIAMAGNESMPILQNDPNNTVTFNLIRALPGTRGQYIAFDFFDAADGSGASGGTVRIIAPTDATGSIKATANIPNCKHAKNNAAYANAANCTVSVSNSTHNGQLEHIVIPIPSDYNCNPATLGGCWFSVQITFTGSVTDFTTWTANIGGDPVRLVK